MPCNLGNFKIFLVVEYSNNGKILIFTALRVSNRKYCLYGVRIGIFHQDNGSRVIHIDNAHIVDINRITGSAYDSCPPPVGNPAPDLIIHLDFIFVPHYDNARLLLVAVCFDQF